MATDLYDPNLDDPALSVRELAELFGDLLDLGAGGILVRAKKYLDLLIDGEDAANAWVRSGLAKAAGPFDLDGDGQQFRFRGLPGRFL